MNEFLYIKTPSVFFSDLHVKANENIRYELLHKFLDSEQTKQSQQIFFLGDIFDLMIGPHKGYFTKYKTFFDTIAEYLKEGKTIFYFQGNHDFHLKILFDLFIEKYQLKNGLILLDGPTVFKFNDKKIYLSHGDELDLNNKAYQKYKKVIRSNFVKFLANYIIPESFLNFVASALAKNSKDNQKNFDWNTTFVLYRNYIQKLWDQGIQGVIIGHSHVCDAWEEGIHFYYNVGYAPEERQFLFLNQDGLQFVPLD